MERNMEYYIEVTGEVMLDNLERRTELVNDICRKYIDSEKKNLCIIASGSSLNASLAAEPFMRKILNCSIECVSPTEYTDYKKQYYKDHYKILISQSGCSTNIIEAAKVLNKENEEYVALTGNLDADLKRYASNLIEYGVGNETVDYVTLGMTTLIEFLIMFSLEVSKTRQTISAKDYEKLIEQIKICCKANTEMFEASKKFTDRFRKELLNMDKAFIITDSPDMGIAREGTIKFGETLKFPVMYYESEEYIHGPNMQLTPDYTVFFIDTNVKHDRMYEVFEATKLITKHTYMVTNKIVEDGDDVLNV